MQLAQGEFLCFLDSDVVVEASTLESMLSFLEHSEADGTFGSYAANSPVGSRSVSTFRNLLHRRVHWRCAGQVASFWTGLGALRREAFLDVGGFDEALSDSASIEDVELGARLSQEGYRVVLAPEFEGTHLKQWSWRSMITTDIWQRALPWTWLVLLGRVDSKVMNGGWTFRLPPILLLLALGLSVLSPQLGGYVGLIYLISILPLVTEVARDGGVGVAFVSIPGLIVHHLCCWAGAMLGGWRWLREDLPTPSLLEKDGDFRN